MKYEKYKKGDFVFEGKMFLWLGSTLLCIAILLPHALFPSPPVTYIFYSMAMVFLIGSLIFLFIARHREKEYKITRTIYKMKGIDLRTGKLVGGPIHLPYTPGFQKW